MLVYEYKCKKCEKEYYFRTHVPYNGETLQCPNCGSEDYEIAEYSPQTHGYSDWNSGPSTHYG